MKKQGQQVPSYSKKDDENCQFKAAMGKYIKGKQVHPLIQQQLIKVITKDIQNTFNQIYIEYAKCKRNLTLINEKFINHAQSLEIRYDQNDCPLSKQAYRFSEIKDDVNQLLRQRHRTSLNKIPVKTQ